MSTAQQLIKSSPIKKSDAELLLQLLLDIPKSKLYTLESISPEIEDKFINLSKIRGKTKAPLQYLAGACYFYGHRFRVITGVFIPRPETELLVEFVLDYIRQFGKNKNMDVADMGAGCGNISLSLAMEAQDINITGIEINSLAWQCSGHNKRTFEKQKKLKGKVQFLLGDMLQAGELNKKFDIIVSNPPYLPFGIKQILPREVKCEPDSALFASEDGLFFYRKIMQLAKSGLLNKGGRIFFEIPEDKTNNLTAIASKIGFKHIKVSKDLTGRDRICELHFA